MRREYLRKKVEAKALIGLSLGLILGTVVVLCVAGYLVYLMRLPSEEGSAPPIAQQMPFIYFLICISLYALFGAFLAWRIARDRTPWVSRLVHVSPVTRPPSPPTRSSYGARNNRTRRRNLFSGGARHADPARSQLLCARGRTNAETNRIMSDTDLYL